MVDPRIKIIGSLLAEPEKPIKYHVSVFPMSRGTFFKAKSGLDEIGVIRPHGKRGYVRLDTDKARDFLRATYPELEVLFGGPDQAT